MPVEFSREIGTELPGEKNSFGLDVDTEEANWELEERRANAIIRHVILLAIPSEFVQVRTQGDRVRVYGQVEDQDARARLIVAVGNIAGVATVEDEIQTECTGDEPIFHTVTTSDTLFDIARVHYGNPDLFTKIFDANRSVLSDPKRLFPGQVLYIPPKS